jgi:ligand-binding sensor domain-containing protein/signal transduction histidine kinase
LFLPRLLQAEQLPIKTYTAADGLSGNRINQIFRDSHGFLWMCTYEGLSRFDGYRFTNHRIGSGPIQPNIRAFLESQTGVYLVATKTGLYQLGPANALADRNSVRRMPKTFEADFSILGDWSIQAQKGRSIWALVEDGTGLIWVGTAAGLYQLRPGKQGWAFQYIDIGLSSDTEDDTIVGALVVDHHGNLWIGSESGLYRRFSDGRTERYTTRHGLPLNEIRAIFEDRGGQLWLATRLGLCELVSEPQQPFPVVARVYTEADGLPSRNVTSICQSSDGALWIGLIGGLAELVPGGQPGRRKFRAYTASSGLSDVNIWALGEDRDHNLWMGSENGVMKFAQSGFTSYGQRDGLGDPAIASIFEDQSGALCVSSISGPIFLDRFDGIRFQSVKPRLPKNINYYGWGWGQLSLQDHRGNWWIPTGQGLCRFSDVSTLESLGRNFPRMVYDSRNGLPSADVFRVYEDSQGDIWIATFAETGNGITRWERATETLHAFSEADGLPLRTSLPSDFCEDASGNLWIGFDNGAGLARYQNGRFTLFESAGGGPQGEYPSLHVDHVGRLWVATGSVGLIRIDHPNTDHPAIVTLTTTEGLSSNKVLTLTEDHWHRLYVGTSRGVDRLDPVTGHIKHYTSSDGLVSGEVRTSFVDHQGNLWFGTKHGLSRLIPKADPSPIPPPILVGALRINGVSYPVSQLGETQIAQLRLKPDQNDVQIDFFGLSFSPGEVLRYRYRLEGTDKEWSALTEQRTISYASLSPGSYRFQVQAVDTDGNTSPRAATVSFIVLSPLWRRGWFLALVALSGGMVVLAFYRYRVAKLVELERVRTRIATDLHDDVGSGLTQIAILSEVARKQVGEPPGSVAQPLAQIANVSRELVDSMSDIVWAINPKRDRLSDLSQRMRELASDLFSPRNIDLRLRTPSAEENVTLDPEIRRQLFLVFKEGVTNMVSHSGCTHVNIQFVIENERLRLNLSDNGCGFDPARADSGNGLRNMQERVKRLNGVLKLNSSKGKGTVIDLVVPLSQRRFSARS